MAGDLSSRKDQISNSLQMIQRDVNCLCENNKSTRRRAIEKITKEMLRKAPPLKADILQGCFESILKPVLKLFSDPSEKCRELSIQFVLDSSTRLEDMTPFLPYVIPVCVQRLGQQEIVETCEELRLLIMELLTALVVICKENIALYVDDFVTTLCKAIADPFHHVKKEGCKCICLLAKMIPKQFYCQAEVFVKPLMLVISHQHSKVRLAVIETIGVVIQGSDGKDVDIALPHLAQRTFDDNPAVRMMVFSVVGKWLLHLRDRYSYFHKLIPLLLTGLSDEITDIRTNSTDLFSKVGEQYEIENEQDFKDKQDFQVWDNNVCTKGGVRRNLGCRALIERNMSKILPAILRDMTDWTAAARIKAASLLRNMLYYAEDNATQYIESLLSGLYKGCRDDEAIVVHQVFLCAELIGRYVEPKVYTKLCLQQLKSASTSTEQQIACVLQILAAMIEGAPDDKIRHHIKEICDAIVCEDVCHSECVNVQEQLLKLVHVITSKASSECSFYSLQLFFVLLHVMSLQREKRFDAEIERCMVRLAFTLQLPSKDDIYKLHTEDVLELLKDSHTSWTSHSSSALLFNTLMLNAGAVVGTLLADIIPVFKVCLHPDKDPELRLKFFSLLSKLSMDSNRSVNSNGEFPQHCGTMLIDCIVPNLLWRAGRVAIAVRTAAISTFWAILQSNLLLLETFNNTLKEILTEVIPCLEDHSSTTRSVTCQVLEKLLNLCKEQFEVDCLHLLYPELLKRMDDSSDEVRLFVTKAFQEYFRAFPSDYDKELNKLHIEAVFKGLLVHLDDPSSTIQAFFVV
ncbi:dynein axonemal assembly factor 5-like isoform X2 [Xenia sp. Carnegie-2017]|uniref:dynein axonemal assembly factor 5-like isoform X2 n=1 Tax=Xenia sp. Carnegie-2017 TaxID=2897299 RepID=UPI001F03924A|nr:dynein axonemal assembly factor 5-like isoform X2 [Xenia sp. Carnegie-2017]